MSIIKKATTTFVGVSLAAIMVSGSVIPASAAPTSLPTAVVMATAGDSIDKSNQKQIIDVFNGINAFRESKGLSPLTFNVTASEVAEDWTDNMSGMGKLVHNTYLAQDSRVAGLYYQSGEIIASRPDTQGQGLVNQWIVSPSHNLIMSDPAYQSMGIGVAITDGSKDPDGAKLYGTTNFYRWGSKPPAGTYRTAQDYFDGKPSLDAPANTTVNTVAPTVNPRTGDYVIPNVQGIDYLVNGKNVSSGTGNSTASTIVITAVAQSGYRLMGTVYWSVNVTPEPVTPKAPTFDAKTGKFTIPVTTGVTYKANGNNISAGTYDSGWTKIDVTVVAERGYILSGVNAWSYTFTESAIFATAPTFDSRSGVYTIPNDSRVFYYADTVPVGAGSYKANGKQVVITVSPKAGYKITGTTSWNYDFSKPTVIDVTTVAPTFTASTGKYVVPNVAGIQYVVNGKNVNAGTYDSGWAKIDVKATAKDGYIINGTNSWSYTFTKPIVSVTTVAPAFTASTGKYVIPNVAGVQYYANGKAINAGTYDSGWAKVTVTSTAKAGYKLSGSTSWNYTFVRPVSPSIPSSGSIITIDSAGNLWNYGTNPRKLIGAGWGGFKEIHVTDWNSDGVLDIIGQTKSGQIYFYNGNKYGGFGKQLIGNGGWAGYDIDVAKWKKTDRYPSIIAKEIKTGKLFNYSNPSGNGMGARTQIGAGWGGLSINLLDWDRDGNIDIIAKNNIGQLKLYRTNGKGVFINESRKTIGSGWGGFNTIQTTNGYGGAGTSGLMTRTANGDIYYYHANKNSWVAGKKVGNGWAKFNIAAH